MLWAGCCRWLSVVRIHCLLASLGFVGNAAPRVSRAIRQSLRLVALCECRITFRLVLLPQQGVIVGDSIRRVRATRERRAERGNEKQQQWSFHQELSRSILRGGHFVVVLRFVLLLNFLVLLHELVRRLQPQQLVREHRVLDLDARLQLTDGFQIRRAVDLAH